MPHVDLHDPPLHRKAYAIPMKLQEPLRKVFNVVILGVAAKHMDFAKEDWIKVIEKTVPAKTIDINKAAFEAGYNL